MANNDCTLFSILVDENVHIKCLFFQAADHVLAPPTCLCNRPLQDILCRFCGYIFVGRMRKRCRYHPTEIHLMDITCCPKCKSAYLLEIQGTQKQPERDSPGKSFEVEQALHSGKGDQNILQVISDRKKHDLAAEQSTNTSIQIDKSTSSSSRQLEEATEKMNNISLCDSPNQVNATKDPVPKMYKPLADIRRTVYFGDDQKTKTEMLEKPYGNSSNPANNENVSNKINVSSRNAVNPKFVQSEAQADITANVQFQYPTHVQSLKPMAPIKQQTNDAESVKPSLRVPVASSAIVATKSRPHGNIPVVSEHVYGYNPRKAVGESSDHSLLLKVIKQHRSRDTMGFDYSDLT